MTADAVAVEHDPFGGGDIARLSPSTEPQREVVAAAMLSPEANTAYNEGVSLRLSGPYDAARIEWALRTLVDRHDALRTTFTPQLDTLCVTTRNDFMLAQVDLTTTPPSGREAEVQRVWQEMVSTPMDLLRGPLFAARLLRFADTDAELVLMVHHAVCDGWSYHVLLREFGALCADPAVVLPPAPSFAAFAAGLVQSEDRAAERWWLQRLADGPAALDLPTDRVRSSRRAFAARRIDRRFAPATTTAMTAAAGRLRASVVSVLVAGVAALMHRLCEASDVLLGMPVARQGLTEMPNMVGHCVHLLPVRVAVDEAQRFEDLVATTRTAVLDATDHFDFTFGSLVRGLGLSGDASRVPLIPVLVNVDQPLADLALGPCTAKVRTVPRTAEGFEIFFNVMPTAAGWVVETTFQSELFTEATIAAWLAALEQLLLAGCADPATPVAMLRLSEASGAGDGFAATDRRLDHETWLSTFADVVRRQPAAIAAVDAARQVPYAELHTRCRALAAELGRRGIGRGDVVGLRMRRSSDLLVAMAGIHLAGAAFVPLDPDFPLARQQFQLQDAGVRFVVGDGDAAVALAMPGLQFVDVRAVAPNAGAAASLPEPGGDDLAYVIYTSGSTGKPKGVRVQHRPLANLLRSMAVRPGLGPDDTLVAITTVGFDISLLELLLPLFVGARVVVADRDEAEDPQRLAMLLEHHRASVMQATPATWQLLLEDRWPGRPGLRALCGGERLRRDLAAALLPKVAELWNLYGPTETCVWSTVARVAASDSAALVGTPIDNTRVVVLDRSGTPLPRGLPGEICIGGMGLAEGYQNLPNLTAERFIEHAELGRLYRTGDRGRIRPEGVLECMGRIDQQVKVRGFRIELGEIEAVLAEQASVVDAAVVVEDGGNGARIVAHVVVRDPAPAANELKAALRARLPEYMVPQQLVFLPQLPRLPNGKLDRRALPRPDAVALPPSEGEAPATELERIVAGEMAAVLRVERLGVDQGFFDAGGHSLLAAQLLARLNRLCESQLTLRSVFEAPTPRELARRIAAGERTRSQRPRIAVQPVQDRLPATHQQERIWFLQHMVPESTTYNLPSAHRLRGHFDLAAFQRALQTIVDRQAVLRTTFERHNGRLRQIVHPSLTVQFEAVEDLSGLPAAEREQRLRSRCEAFVARRFDLSRLPLFAVHLFRMAADEHVFFFMPHHIVWDGWSFDVLYEEMAALYAAFSAGKPDPLPALPVTYGDFAAWHRQWMASPEVAQQVAVWQERLVRFGPVKPLVSTSLRSVGMSGEGATEHVAVDAQRTAALRQLGRDHNATLFATLLAAYAVLLHEFGRTDRLLLATPLRGRDQEELEGVMGCCNNLLPLLLEIDAKDTFRTLLVRTRGVVLDSLANPDVTMEAISSGISSGQGSLLYQALFSFQDVRRRQQRWGSLEHEMVHVFQRGATEDLGLWFVEGRAGLQGGLAHNTRLIPPALAQDLRQRLQQIVDAVIADPERPLRSIVEASPLRPPAAAPLADDGVSLSDGAGHHEDRPDGPGALSSEVRRDYEFVLARIWCRILGVSAVGVHDDFFRLGGNSLGLIRCVTEFEHATGVSLDLGRLMRSPTLASAVDGIAGNSPRQQVLVIPLQEAGAGVPLYCLVGIGVYRHFADAMAGDRPILGMYAHGEEALFGHATADSATSTDVASIAGRYVAEILARRPSSGVYLAGLSFGGVVAMEAARRLVAEGVTVRGVILLDTIMPGGYQRSPMRRLRESRVAQLLRRVLRRLGGGADPEASLAAETRLERALQLERETLRWQARFPGASWPVVLIRATDSSWGPGVTFRGDLGWSAVAGRQLTIIDVGGDHLGILQPPRVTELVAKLRAWMK